MSTFRKLSVITLSFLFRFTLFFSIGIATLVFLYTDNQYIKTVLSENNVYARFVDSVIDTNENQKISSGESVKISDPEIRQIINEAFPPNDLQNITESVIDKTYLWLEKDSDSLSFTIDLTQNKQTLAEGLSVFAIDRLKTLPLCAQYTPTIDPFSADCQPSSFDFDVEQQSLSNQLFADLGIFEDPVINEQIITKNMDQKTLENFEKIPTFYNYLKYFSVAATIFLFLLAIVIIRLCSTRARGIRRIGKSLLSTGISLIIFTIIFSFVFPNLTGNLPILQSSGDGIDNLLNDVAIDLGINSAMVVIKICAPLILIGGLMVLSANKIERKSKFNYIDKKSGVISSEKSTAKSSKSKKIIPPIQSSEVSLTKPPRKTKNKKYRKIPKKEI